VIIFTPRPLYPQAESSPGTHWIGGWVGPRAGLVDLEYRKLLPLPGLELRPLGRPAHSQSLHRLRYPGTHTNFSYKFKMIYIITDFIKALLGNSSMNTFQHTRHATTEEAVFSMWSVPSGYRRILHCVRD
jgi:hypothetical protein